MLLAERSGLTKMDSPAIIHQGGGRRSTWTGARPARAKLSRSAPARPSAQHVGKAMSPSVASGSAKLHSWESRAAWSIVCLVATLVLFLPPEPVVAQAEPPSLGANLTFRSLTRAQGLAHPTVRSILQNQRGFMWFGTNAGLNRYDGYRFTDFPSEPDVSSGP